MVRIAFYGDKYSVGYVVSERNRTCCLRLGDDGILIKTSSKFLELVGIVTQLYLSAAIQESQIYSHMSWLVLELIQLFTLTRKQSNKQ